MWAKSILHLRRLPALRVVATLAAALLVAPTSAAAPLPLAPQYAGSFATGSGSDAHFLQIDSQWRGSQVLWNETTQTFGNGEPISNFSWGTGLWGRVDWQQVQAAAGGTGGPGSPPIVNQYNGQAASINFGNSRYNECYSSTWGQAALLPFFTAAPDLGQCNDAAAGDPGQQNWTARFTGFVRIVDPGDYNFSVLYDDGYFLRLIGAGGQALEIEQDYLNPRDREGFTNDLQLSPGLYGFELGAWNRLGAGVVDLRWSRGGGDWTLVPTENLLPNNVVPEPPLPLLLALAAALSAQWGRAGGAGRLRRQAARLAHVAFGLRPSKPLPTQAQVQGARLQANGVGN
jgi:hypothetical protein